VLHGRGESIPMEQELPLNYQRLESALRPPSEVYHSPLAERWHNTLADPSLDCVPKKSARAIGAKTVRCVCGCRQDFPAEVRG